MTATELGAIRGEPPELSPTAKTRIATAAATNPSSAAPTVLRFAGGGAPTVPEVH